MPLDDVVGNGQAQTRARFLGGKERIKDVVHNVGRNSLARVVNLQQHQTGEWVMTGANYKLTALGHGFHRIQTEIEQNLLQLIPHTGDVGQVWIWLKSKLNIVMAQVCINQLL